MSTNTSLNNRQVGTLYIVATPIGHLNDISERAAIILRQVDAIAAEDTRHSQRLMQALAIETPLFSLHAHNEMQRVKTVIARLLSGQSIALISDAGTPLVHDPGYPLVKACHSENIEVVPIPGACALIAALSASGLPASQFFFEGFLPAKSTARIKQLTTIKLYPHTLIFYEAPHRVLAMMHDVITVLGGERTLVIARELTKSFEQIKSGTAKSLLTWLEEHKAQQKGEFVVLVAGYEVPKRTELCAETKRVYALLCDELPLKRAVYACAKITGEKKNKIYEYALSLTKL